MTRSKNLVSLIWIIENNLYNILLYANDIVLLSETDSGLQNCLINRLHSYCESWKLEVNIDKSKVIVFNSNGKTYKRHVPV